MNERIQELWNKAAESTATYPNGQNNSWETQINFMEKFAELIVRECCDIFVELRNRPADLAVKDVRKHFGVE